MLGRRNAVQQLRLLRPLLSGVIFGTVTQVSWLVGIEMEQSRHPDMRRITRV